MFLKVACWEEILTNDVTVFADLTLSDRNIHHLIEIELIFHKNFLGTWDSFHKRVNIYFNVKLLTEDEGFQFWMQHKNVHGYDGPELDN